MASTYFTPVDTKVNQYDPILPNNNGLNNLFARLEAMRAGHYTASSDAGSSTTGITSAFATTPAVRNETARQSTVSDLSTRVSAVINSGSFQANKGNFNQTNISPIPAIGDLIKATDFNAWNTTIKSMEGVCAHYSRYGTHYGTRYGSQYGSHYSGQYGSRYGGHYGSHYSWYTQRYGQGWCLAKNTKILMKNNILKNIEDVNIGEEVISWNELTKKAEVQKVLEKSVHQNTINMIDIILSNNSKIRLTEGHPVLTTSGWKSRNTETSLLIHGIYTNKLQIGDELVGIKNNLKVIDIKPLSNENKYETYNLQIDNIHNFIVIPEEKEIEYQVIVHNDKQK